MQVPVHHLFELMHVPERAAGMGGHQIVGQIPSFIQISAPFVEQGLELQQTGRVAFAHDLQHLITAMFRGQFELAGDVMFDQLFQIGFTAG